MSKDLKTILKEKLDERGIKIPKLAKMTGIPKDRIYAWYRDNTNPKSKDEEVITKWINGETFTLPKFQDGSFKSEVTLEVDTLLKIVRDANDKVQKTLEEQNQFLQRLVETSLNSTPDWAKTIILSQTAHDEVIMNAIDRLEKKPEGTLAAESDKLESAMKDRLKNEHKTDKSTA